MLTKDLTGPVDTVMTLYDSSLNVLAFNDDYDPGHGLASRIDYTFPSTARYYLQVRDRLGHQRAALSVARKLARWCHHTLRALGDAAWEAVEEEGTGRGPDVMTCGQLRGPECCHEPALDSPQRMSGRNLRGDDPIDHHVTGARSERRDKSGRPRTGSPSSGRREQEVAAMG